MFRLKATAAVKGSTLYAWARARVRSRSNMDAMTVFSVLMVSRTADESFRSTETRSRALLLTVRPENLEREEFLSDGRREGALVDTSALVSGFKPLGDAGKCRSECHIFKAFHSNINMNES